MRSVRLEAQGRADFTAEVALRQALKTGRELSGVAGSAADYTGDAWLLGTETKLGSGEQREVRLGTPPSTVCSPFFVPIMHSDTLSAVILCVAFIIFWQSLSY